MLYNACIIKDGLEMLYCFYRKMWLVVTSIMLSVGYNILSYGYGTEWKYDAASEYDVYYDGYNKSIYTQLYHNQYIPFDNWIIQDEIANVSKNKETVVVMDFGAGDGRHFPIYQEAAQKLESQHKTLKLVAYDISKNAIKNYQSALVNLGYKEVKENILSNNFHVAVFTKNNLTVLLVYPISKKVKISDLSAVIGKIDLTFSIFGVIEHIQTRDARTLAIKDIMSLTDQLFFSVGSYRVLTEERKAFECFRKNKIQLQINHKDVVFEKGDLIYARNYNGKHVENYYHVYESAEEILEEIKKTGIDLKVNFGISKIMHETTSINYPVLGKVDMYLSRLLSVIMPQKIQDHIAGYYIVSLKKVK